MNEDRIRLWMDAIDDELLEEAQRPLHRGGAVLRWGGLAACLCAAALTVGLWQPWNGVAQTADEAAFSAVEDAAVSSVSPDPLSASLTLPENGELVSAYDLHRDAAGAVSSVSCTVSLNGADYAYTAAYAAQPMTAPDGTQPADTWQLGGLTLLLYDDGAVSWYDADKGIQWYCVAAEDGEPLMTAFALMDAQYYSVPSAPEGAELTDYELFELDGMTVTGVSFTLDNRSWCYRMASTADVTDNIPDISQFEGGSLTAEGTVRWCTTALRWDEGGAGCVIWKDIVPGLTYSLTVDTGAAETLLCDTAALVFKPAQEES